MAEKLKILIIQGPNLNLLGKREKNVYGSLSLEEIHLNIMSESKALGVELDFFQSNNEGILIDRIHNASSEEVNGLIVNAGGLTHSSVALRDALTGVNIPFVEVHISNVHQREEFRHHSYLSPVASGIVIGFGADVYRLGLLGLVKKLRNDNLKKD